jgi:hypothetical protein
MYSVENLPERIDTSVRLSPRSHEAMKRMGLKMDDLATKSIGEVQRMYSDNETDKAMLEKRWEHYETKRLERVKQVLQTRAQVIDEEKRGSWSPQVSVL